MNATVMIHKFKLRYHRPRTNSFLTLIEHATYLQEAKLKALNRLGSSWELIEWYVL